MRQNSTLADPVLCDGWHDVTTSLAVLVENGRICQGMYYTPRKAYAVCPYLWNERENRWVLQTGLQATKAAILSLEWRKNGQ